MGRLKIYTEQVNAGFLLHIPTYFKTYNTVITFLLFMMYLMIVIDYSHKKTTVSEIFLHCDFKLFTK